MWSKWPPWGKYVAAIEAAPAKVRAELRNNKMADVVSVNFIRRTGRCCAAYWTL